MCTVSKKLLIVHPYSRIDSTAILENMSMMICVVLPKSLNQYTYCWNQPLILVDLDGKTPCCPTPDICCPPHTETPQASVKDNILDRFSEENQEVFHAGREAGISYREIIGTGLYGRIAYNTSYSRAIAAGESMTGTIHDAYRHFTWMFNTAQTYSIGTARFFGDQIEIVGLQTYGGRIISQNGNVIFAEFNAYTLQDLWNNSVGYLLGSASRGGVAHRRRAFEDAIARGLLIENYFDVERMFGIQLVDGVARALWDLENNTLTFLGINSSVIIDLYIDPLNGGRECPPF